MKTRHIYLQPYEVVEIHDDLSNSVLKCRILRGDHGNLQCLAYSQPGAKLTVDLPQRELISLLETDPLDTQL